jgi:hypothetical protein
MHKKTLAVIRLGSMSYKTTIRFTAVFIDITLPAAVAAKEAE